MAEATLHAVTKRFGETTAVEDLSLTVGDGEFLVLLGPTGAGKTTTLRLFAGLERPDAGRVEIGGDDMTRRAPADRDVAFVFQQYSLYPHYTVFENLAFPLRAPGRRSPRAAVKKRVGEVAELLRIETKLHSRVTELSGGQMQRVSIGRALVREPRMFLMDEPLSSLDAKLREDLRVELKRIQRDLGATILYVTHDQLEAMTLADRIGVLSEGRLKQLDAPRAVYDAPADIHAAQRLGSPQINLVSPTLFGDAAAPEGADRLGVRPEDVRLNGAGARGRVLAVERLGVETVALIGVGAASDETHIHALLDARAGVAQGDEISVSVRPGAALYFDREGIRMEHSASGGGLGASGGAGGGETALIIACARAIAQSIADNEDEIESLDRAIGDGDHYINMKRGSEAITAMVDELAPLPADQALKAIAKKLLMTIGGASGPLISSFFLDMSKTEGAAGPWTPKILARLMAAGVEAIKRRGKADLGDKTMLDTLIPVSNRLAEMAAAGCPAAEILAALPEIAEAGSLSTRDMLAAKGRAAFLGERAVGHIDPGSKSSAMIIAAICAVARGAAA